MSTTSLTPFRPGPIHASSSSSSRKSDPNRRKQSSANWWAPLFGWSSDPDYINSSSQNPNAGPDPEPEPASEAERPRSRFSLGCFTEEKAKQLRRKTLEGSTFHDAMYHSAIASRLATDLSDRANNEK
ncbi:hypothetical protein L484_005141 [Morus notabilis]|uniref:Uncharacterized protein n=1 Tax=Morus notabilis TaxID=981085 RepID=W9QF73_9ROSA|nr:uncharacterized protein LOC21388621 [Morus notabilis]EXB33249.1 hypothetical protein L484_005141 [Morus notabilis]